MWLAWLILALGWVLVIAAASMVFGPLPISWALVLSHLGALGLAARWFRSNHRVLDARLAWELSVGATIGMSVICFNLMPSTTLGWLVVAAQLGFVLLTAYWYLVSEVPRGDGALQVPLFGKKPAWLGTAERARGTLSLSAVQGERGALSAAPFEEGAVSLPEAPAGLEDKDSEGAPEAARAPLPPR